MTPLIELTLRSSVVLVVGLALSAALRRRSAAVRHAILAAAILAAAVVGPLSRVMPSWDVALSTSLPSGAATGSEVQASETVAVVAGPGSARASAAQLLAAFWGIGFAAAAATLLIGLGRLVLIGARARRVSDPLWTAVADDVSARLGLGRRVILLQTDAPGLLATWGALRPRVLLPSHAHAWTPERARVVLSHELAHVRRHDWIVQIGAEILKCVYWFNPLLWIACARLRTESEQACDDAVLAAGVTGREYATHLVELARLCRHPRPGWVPAMLMARPS